jgi:hypothetical protein
LRNWMNQWMNEWMNEWLIDWLITMFNSEILELSHLTLKIKWIVESFWME